MSAFWIVTVAVLAVHALALLTLRLCDSSRSVALAAVLLVVAGMAGAVAVSHPLAFVQIGLDGRLPPYFCR